MSSLELVGSYADGGVVEEGVTVGCGDLGEGDTTRRGGVSMEDDEGLSIS